MTISVIIPVRNGADFLAEAIRGVSEMVLPVPVMERRLLINNYGRH